MALGEKEPVEEDVTIVSLRVCVPVSLLIPFISIFVEVKLFTVRWVGVMTLLRGSLC